jgi:hypothetical protein
MTRPTRLGKSTGSSVYMPVKAREDPIPSVILSTVAATMNNHPSGKSWRNPSRMNATPTRRKPKIMENLIPSFGNRYPKMGDVVNTQKGDALSITPTTSREHPFF